MARDYLTRAAMTLEEARAAASKGYYSLAVRRAQETVELSLKAALRFLAIEYPKEHDVSTVLRSVKELRPLPPWFAENLELMARVSRELSWKRGAAFYGDEKSATPASQLFTKEDGTQALRDAEEVFQLCTRLIS